MNSEDDIYIYIEQKQLCEGAIFEESNGVQSIKRSVL